MPVRLVDEPIEVIAHFDATGMHPLRFKWQEQTYYITEVVTQYVMTSDQYDFHVHVKGTSEALYQLIFNIPTFTWRLGIVQQNQTADKLDVEYRSTFSL